MILSRRNIDFSTEFGKKALNTLKIFWFGIHYKIHRPHFSVEPVDLIHQTKVFQISFCKIMVCYSKVEAMGTLPRGNRIKRCESVVRVTHDGTISRSTHLVLNWNIPLKSVCTNTAEEICSKTMFYVQDLNCSNACSTGQFCSAFLNVGETLS